MNRIHGADLAKVWVSEAEDGRSALQVGGPQQAMTYSEMAELTFRVLGWMMNSSCGKMKPIIINSILAEDSISITFNRL